MKEFIMSSDFSEIMAAMSQVPDVDIDPESGTTMRASGKTLGQKYQMEDKVSPKMAEKIRENALLNEQGKEASKSTCDAYKEMIGQPTSTQVKEYQKQVMEVQQEAMLNAKQQLQTKQAQSQAKKTSDTILETHYQDLIKQNVNIKQLNEQYSQVNDDMMDAYVNSINKKNKWRK